MKQYCVVIFSFFCFAFFSCNGSESDALVDSDNFIDYKIGKGNDNDLYDASSMFSSITVVNLSEEVSNKIGDVYDFFVDANDEIILVDKVFGVVSKINVEGEMLWQLSPDPGDFKIFNNILEVFFDKSMNNLIVQSSDKIYVYDEDGLFVDVMPKPVFNFSRMHFVSSDEMLYSCHGRLNPHVLDRPMELIWTKNGQIESSFIRGLPHAPKNFVIGGLQEFSKLNESVFYHAPLRDSFYEINLPEVEPKFTISFSWGLNSEDIMRNGNIKNKLNYMYSERVPHLIYTAIDEESIRLVYRVGSTNFFGFCNRETGIWDANHRYLSYNGTTIEAPQLYFDGYLLQVEPDYRINHFNKIEEGASTVSPEWQAELERLDEAYNDVGGKTLYLIKL
jgi:hypothetical protein